mmetsp:Transcript_5749/g.12661  ORF Transcript_5749/g.12661 Transcript_5749/m.12661 type:complete len:215 (-) Transcript_5749:167-811(-)
MLAPSHRNGSVHRPRRRAHTSNFSRPATPVTKISSSVEPSSPTSHRHGARRARVRRRRRASLRHLLPPPPRAHRLRPRRGHRHHGQPRDRTAAIPRGGGSRKAGVHVHQLAGGVGHGGHGHVRHDAVHPPGGAHDLHGTGGEHGEPAAGGGESGTSLRAAERSHHAPSAQRGSAGHGVGHRHSGEGNTENEGQSESAVRASHRTRAGRNRKGYG